MARTTISLPDELKGEMEELGGAVNWSGIAADAFRAEILKVKARASARRGNAMCEVRERLEESRQRYLKEAAERGHADGTKWAMVTAEYGELKRLDDAWPAVGSCDTSDAMGAPGVFLRIIKGDDCSQRSDIDDFWSALGKDDNDDDCYSAEYWDGFVEGALEVFEEATDD
ncbi:MAG: hypothetical protein DYH20_09540 [Gammaproteobacteria bacterium PRO9]|nr:hypothetical protein [Gammaproteobacteria bacterium PRO9]